MKVLMTGATGLVGQALGLELVRRGHQIVAVSRSASSAKSHLPFPCEIIEGDLSQAPLSKAAVPLASVDAVVHLMGESIAKGFWTAQKKRAHEKSRVASTENLIQTFKNHGAKPKVFISTSAIGYYGNRGDEVLTEESSAGEGYLSDLCQKWEAAAIDNLRSLPETRWAIARIGIVLAKAGGMLPEVLPLFQNNLGGVLGGGQQWMSWIHIEDLVRAFIFALENQQVSGVFNAVSPSPIKNIEFTQIIGEQLSVFRAMPAPAWILKTVLGEKSRLLLDSQNVQPTLLNKWGFKFQFSDLKTTLQNLLMNEAAGESVFEAFQYVPLPPEKLFPFFADAHNLEKLTPATLGFQILSVSTPQVQEGTWIEYRLKIHGVPVKWLTEIQSWNPPHQFVDNQEKGPYQLWHHTHRFEKLGSGTLMQDRVRYRLPLGLLGRLGGGAFVRSEVNQIFAFRRQQIEESIKLKKIF